MHISIDAVSKNFRKKPLALNNVTVDLPAGMIGLLGSNGAGKTTLMRTLCGIIQPSSGRILIDGHDIAQSNNRRALKRTLGYLPQDIEPYPNLTPREFLDYIGLLKGMDDTAKRRRQADELLERVALTDVANRRIGGFSGGMRRRVGIAQALMASPTLLVVDEPTAGLDPEERMRFRSLLASLGEDRTVMLSTHILDDVAQTCPYVFVLRHGAKAFDGPTALLVEEARGRTFTLTTTNAPPAHMAIINAAPTPGGTQYRLVGDNPPDNAEPVEPTLEDGYMALATQTEENAR
jgi:ABC-2 type transport system ATP-binding protein